MRISMNAAAAASNKRINRFIRARHTRHRALLLFLFLFSFPFLSSPFVFTISKANQILCSQILPIKLHKKNRKLSTSSLLWAATSSSMKNTRKKCSKKYKVTVNESSFSPQNYERKWESERKRAHMCNWKWDGIENMREYAKNPNCSFLILHGLYSPIFTGLCWLRLESETSFQCMHTMRMCSYVHMCMHSLSIK